MSNYSYLILVVLYTFTFYFAMHQSSHLVAVRSDYRVSLNPILSVLMNLERIAGLAFLVWYGYKTVWYYPILLAAIAFPTTLLLKIIERATKLYRIAWAISIMGIVIVPILLYLMVVHISTTANL